MIRHRPFSVLGALLFIAACSGPQGGDDAPDAGSSVVDGGLDSDAGYSFVPTACQDFGLVTEQKSDVACGCTDGAICGWAGQCTFECVVCDFDTPCPNGGLCLYQHPSNCAGFCAHPVESCGAGPTPSVVTLTTSGSPCIQRPEAYACDLIRRLDLGTGQLDVSLKMAFLDGGSETVQVGSFPASGMEEVWTAAAQAGLWCLSTDDLLANACQTHGGYVLVEVEAADAGNAFGFYTPQGKVPAVPILEAIHRLSDLSSPHLADAGFPTHPEF